MEREEVRIRRSNRTYRTAYRVIWNVKTSGFAKDRVARDAGRRAGDAGGGFGAPVPEGGLAAVPAFPSGGVAGRADVRFPAFCMGFG